MLQASVDMSGSVCEHESQYSCSGQWAILERAGMLQVCYTLSFVTTINTSLPDGSQKEQKCAEDNICKKGK